jgi:PAS domain S-box-containing protein
MSTPRPRTALTLPQLEAVLDAVHDAVITIDRDFIITSFNRAAEQATGCERSQALGRRCQEVMRHRVCRHIGKCPVPRLLATKRDCVTRRYYATDDQGQPLPFSLSAFALRDESGEIVGAIETFRNLAATGTAAQPAGVPPGLALGKKGLRAPANLRILEASQRQVILEVLRRHGWNRAGVCAELGLSRTTLWRKMRRLNISPVPPSRT